VDSVTGWEMLEAFHGSFDSLEEEEEEEEEMEDDAL